MGFVEFIKTRVRNNKNFMAVIVGGTGSGKSYSALRLAECIDPKFSAKRVAFTAEQFTDLITDDSLEAGSVIIFDEAGVGMPSKEWFKIQNKQLGYILQTFRYKRLVVFFTTPYISFIDKTARGLFHVILETKGIIRNKKLCKLRPKLISPNRTWDKVYYPQLKLQDADGIVKLDLLVNLPSKKLMKEYEKAKQAYAREMYKDIKENFGDSNPMSDLTEQERVVLEARKLEVPYSKIANRLNVSEVRARGIALAVRRKGYNI